MGRGGGRGFRGGGGFGSSSHPYHHHNSTSDTIMRDAAASKGLRSFGSSWWPNWLVEGEKVEHCKCLVQAYEECAITSRKGRGKDDPVCQYYPKELEKYCAEYKSSWSDWWSNELKQKYCKRITGNFKRCMTSDKKAELAEIYRDELEEICGIVVD